MNAPIISRIQPRLYVGNAAAAANIEILRREEIRNVVSVMKLKYPQIKGALYQKLGIGWKYFPIKDNHEFTDSEGRLIVEIFPWMKIGESVYDEAFLVHCEMGISRSSSFVITYLVWGGMPFEQAFGLVTEKHPIARPSLPVIESFLKCIGVSVSNPVEILKKNIERACEEIRNKGL